MSYIAIFRPKTIFLLILISGLIVSSYNMVGANSNVDTETQAAILANITLDVDTTIDSNAGSFQICSGAGSDCSLRGAISKANADTANSYTINIPAGTYTIALTGSEDSNVSGDLDVINNVTLTGAGAGSTIIDGGGIDRPFDTFSGYTITLENMTITNGNSGASDVAHAGGIYNAATLTVRNSTISSNTSGGDGGGIYNVGGSLTLIGSTVSGNSADEGAGIYATAPTTIQNSTLSGNAASLPGGAISTNSIATIQNSTFAANSASSGDDLYAQASGSITADHTILASTNGTICATAGGSLLSSGYNIDRFNTCGFAATGDLTNTDPLLGALADNGGSTQTYALQSGSPAIDAGNTTCNVTTDQRGEARPSGANCDIGAFERLPLSCPTGGVLYVTPTGAGTQDGESWTNAMTLQSALTVTNACDIWAAQGVYTPGTDAADTFNIGANIGVYGGYAGTGTTRDSDLYKTVLSGDIDNNDTNKVGGVTTTHSDIVGTNSRQVVTFSNVTGTTVLDGVTVTGGDGGTTHDGGGINCVATSGTTCSPTLSNLQIVGNRARNGGGLNIYTSSGTASPTISNTTISNNASTNAGGGLHITGYQSSTSSPTFTNVDVLNNETASQGGGLRILVGSQSTVNPTWTGGNFVGNSAVGDKGGGVYVFATNNAQVTPHFKNIIFVSNSAATQGGALTVHVNAANASNTAFASPTLEQVLIVGNTAQRGGGIYHYTYGTHAANSDSDLTVINSTIANNTATIYGGGVYNFAKGGGAFIANNTIIANNVAQGTTVGQNILNNPDGVVTLNYSLLPSNSNTDVLVNGNAVVNYGAGMVYGDPRFVDVDGADNVLGNADDDLQLRLSSPAVNSGDNSYITGITTDLAGNTRIQDTTVDMGVYETATPLTCPGGGILYVNGSNTGTQDGTSWATAFAHLEDALTVSGTCDIWVAGGTYTPGTDPSDTFSIGSNISVYGGYAGSGGSPDTRDGTTHPTVLSGDIDNNDVNKDGNGVTTDHANIRGTNSSRVVYMTGSNNGLYSGIIVTGGDGGTTTDGAGIYCDGCRGTLEAHIIGNRARHAAGLLIIGSGDTASPTVRNNTISNNKASSLGGGVYMYGTGSSSTSSPTFTNVDFLDNEADNGGGVRIATYSSATVNPTFTGGSFVGNNTTSFGGAVSFYATSSGQMSPTFTDINIADNSSGTYAGGALSVSINTVNSTNTASASPTFEQVQMVGNSAPRGGAVYHNAYGAHPDNSDSDLTFVNSTIANNTAAVAGGGIHNTTGGNGRVVFNNSIIANNEAQGSSTGQQILNNSNGIVELNNSLLPSNNNADVQNDSGSTVTYGTGMVYGDPRFVDVDGADDVLGNTDDDLQLRLSSPAVNSGDNSYITGITTDLAGNTRIQDTTVDMGVYETATPLTCPGGGILYVNGSNTGTQDGTSWATAFAHLEDALTVSGTCDIWVAGGTYTPGTDPSDTFSIGSNISVYGGYAGSGGSPDTRDGTTHPTVLSGDIDNNDTNKDSHGMTPTAGDIVGTNSYHVVTMTGTGNRLDGVVISGGDATNHSGLEVGGAIWCQGLNGGTCNPTLFSLWVQGNKSVQGNVYLDGHNGGTSSPTIDGSTFISNTATNYGGAIFLAAGTNGTSNPTIQNSTFKHNQAGQHGGAIRIGAGGASGQASPIIQNSTFENNSAHTGGGVYAHVAGGAMSAPQFTDVTFKSNSVTEHGGGVRINNDNGTSTPTFTDVRFENNQAAEHGGGLFTVVFSIGQIDTQMQNVVFEGNSAGRRGGAFGAEVVNVDAGSPGDNSTTIKQTLFNGNSASDDGGAIFFQAYGTSANLSPSTMTVINSTIANNTATRYGGGLYNMTGGNGRVVFNNSIIANNEAQGSSTGEQIANISEGIVQFNYSLLPSNTAADVENESGSTVTYGTGMVYGDPLFVDVDGADNVLGNADDDLQLRLSSPAVNAGDNSLLDASITTDLDGNARLSGSTIDLGVYERQLGAAPFSLDDTLTTAEDTAATIDVLSNDVESDAGAALFVGSVTQPSNGSAVVSGDSIIYTPSTDFNGIDVFTYDVSDGSATDSATVTVTVTAVNDAPVAVDDAYTTMQGTPLIVGGGSRAGVPSRQAVITSSVKLLDNDSDVDGDALSVASTFLETGDGTVIFSADGGFAYIPNADFVGTDVFTYTIKDTGGLTAEATTTIVVNAVSVDVSLPVAGWNLFGYPMPDSRNVADALISISGVYTTVWGYNASAATWQSYDVTVAPFVNDLIQLEFGQGYWILVGQPTTISFSRGSLVQTTRAFLPPPPMRLYGEVLNGQSGQTVEAYIGDVLCGAATTEIFEGRVVYVLDVVGHSDTAGCGLANHNVQLRVNEIPQTVELQWQLGAVVEVDLNANVPTGVTLSHATVTHRTTAAILTVALLSGLSTLVVVRRRHA